MKFREFFSVPPSVFLLGLLVLLLVIHAIYSEYHENTPPSRAQLLDLPEEVGQLKDGDTIYLRHNPDTLHIEIFHNFPDQRDMRNLYIIAK